MPDYKNNQSDENTTESSKTTIDLINSSQAGSFSVTNSFFKEELKGALDLVKKALHQLNKTEKYADINRRRCTTPSIEPLLSDHMHQATLVVGDRGIGKTSFLLTLRKQLKKEFPGKLAILNPMDPTLMEDTELFLTNIIAAICELVERSRQGSSCHHGGESDDGIDGQYMDWQKTLVELSSHLQVLGGKSHTLRLLERSLAPEVLANEFLSFGHGGQKLAQAFHKFVASTIMYLRRENQDIKAIVLLLDDVDAAVDKGWPVLETIRKYLDTPQLIVIAAGELRLYKLVIHLEYLKRIKALENESRRLGRKGIPKEVQEAESAYLHKVFPLEWRVHLNSPTERDLRDFKIRDENGKFYNLDKLFMYFSIVMFWGRHYAAGTSLETWNPSTRVLPKNSREFIRFIIHVLKPVMKRLTNEEECDPEHNGEIGKELAERLIEANASLLWDHGFDPEELKNALSEFKERWLFIRLLTGVDGSRSLARWERGYILNEDYSDRHKNRVILTLQAAFNQGMRGNAIKMARYWFIVAEPWLAAMENLGRDPEQDLLTRYLAYTRYESGEQASDLHAWDVCWRYRNSQKEIVGSDRGIVDAGIGVYDSEPEEISPPIQFLSDFFSFYVATPHNGVLRHFSFRYGLANLVVVMSLAKLIKVNSGQNNYGAKLLQENLERYAQVRYFPASSLIPRGFQGELNTDSKSSLSEINPTNVEYGQVVKEIAKALESWMRLDLRGSEMRPIPMLAGAWRRFRYQLYHATNLMLKKANKRNVGEMLRTSTFVFLNALLVEEMIHIGHGDIIDRRNPDMDCEILIKNLKSVQDNLNNAKHDISERLFLFSHWAACPLFSMYTPFNERPYTRIRRLFPGTKASDMDSNLRKPIDYFIALKEIKFRK
jgi:hypothetical protein